MPYWIALLTVITSWVGVVVSFVFAHRARQDQQKAFAFSAEANRIQEQMLELSRKQKAARKHEASTVRWECGIEQLPGDQAIVITNVSPGRATHVRVLINGMPVDSHPNVTRKPEREDIGLDAGASLRYSFTITHSSPLIDRVTVLWQAQNGHEEVFNTIVR